MIQPNLFEISSASVEKVWQEVPQARFFSWSPKRQLLYCAIRDEDAARRDGEFEEFYLTRAALYRQEAKYASQTIPGNSAS